MLQTVLSHPLFIPIVVTLVIIAVFPLVAGYIVLVERKVLADFAVLPFTKTIYVADVNVGLLVVSATSAVGILGIILGGWSSNSHYSLLGALRSAAQLVSYEVALSFALLSGLM